MGDLQAEWDEWAKNIGAEREQAELEEIGRRVLQEIGGKEVKLVRLGRILLLVAAALGLVIGFALGWWLT